MKQPSAIKQPLAHYEMKYIISKSVSALHTEELHPKK